MIVVQFTVASCNVPHQNTGHVDPLVHLSISIRGRPISSYQLVWEATLSIFNTGGCPTTYLVGPDLVTNKIYKGSLHIRVQVDEAPCAAALQHFLELSPYVLEPKQTKKHPEKVQTT